MQKTKEEKEGNKIKKQNAKLRNGATCGKLVENPLNKVDVNIVTTRKKYLKWSFRPTFKREKQFRKGFIANKKEKCGMNLNKPVFLGTSILDLSKVLIQDVHCNYIKNKNGDTADSLIYKIKSENVYEDLLESCLTSVFTLKIENITMA